MSKAEIELAIICVDILCHHINVRNLHKMLVTINH